MKKFIFLMQGYETPSKEVMDAWMKWFASIGDKMVDSGNPFGPGREITKSGVKDLAMDKDATTGYCIINAESMEEAEKIAKECPIITSIRIYEGMAM